MIDNKKLIKIKVGNILLIAGHRVQMQRVARSITALRLWDKKEYERAQRLLRTIFIHPNIRAYNLTHVSEGVWLVGHDLFSEKDFDLPYVSSLIVHEVHHIAQYRSGKKYAGAKAENFATARQIKFLRKIGYDSAIPWLERQFEGKWWGKMDRQGRNKKIMERDWRMLDFLRHD